MKYVTKRQKAYWDDEDWYPDAPAVTVYEDDEPQYTGLLDAHGEDLYRVKERAPIGFRCPTKS